MSARSILLIVASVLLFASYFLPWGFDMSPSAALLNPGSVHDDVGVATAIYTALIIVPVCALICFVMAIRNKRVPKFFGILSLIVVVAYVALIFTSGKETFSVTENAGLVLAAVSSLILAIAG